MRIKAIALVCAAICTSSSPALASDTGWFVGIGNGVSLPADVTAKWKNAGTTLRTTDFGFSPTWRGTASFGYAFDFGIRLEGEFGYTHPSFDDNSANLLGVSSASFRVRQGLANVFYDVPLSRNWLLNLGVGAGYGWTAIIRDDAVGSTAEALTGQLIAGLTYRLTDTMDIQFDYRYVAVHGLSYKDAGGAGVDANVNWAGSHNLMLTVRLFFDNTPNQVRRQESAPPPMPYIPPPAPASPPPRASAPVLAAPITVFVVYFDFNKSQLDESARTIIAAAVKTAKTNGWVKVLVTGHTDTVGTQSYNTRLSTARARAVREEMIRDGMDGTSITILGAGWFDPVVSTGPSQREPRNRRAVISLGDHN